MSKKHRNTDVVPESPTETTETTETTESTPVVEELSAALAAVEPKVKGRVKLVRAYFLTDSDPLHEKLFNVPKQMRQIAQLIIAAGDQGITTPNLLDQMVPVVQTRQGVDRIFAYYRKRLINELGVEERGIQA